MLSSAGQAAGVVAACLVFSTFYMRTMLPLRCVAIASNVAFVTYGLVFGLWPIWVLHGVLLPLNVVRLVEIKRLVRKLQAARTGEIDPVPLLQQLPRQHIRAGENVFAKGDHADCAYVIGEGTVAIPEVGVTVRTGTVFGELGVFSPSRTRTASAVAVTDCELYRLSERDIVTAFYQNPAFALSLMRLIVRRQSENMRAIEERASQARSAVC